MQKIALIGRPNTGKSRLFNRLSGSKKSLVSDIPGTTRDRVIADIEAKIPYTLIDTGGIDMGASGLIEEHMALQVKLALEDADILLLLFDSKNPPLPDDFELVKMLQRNPLYKEKIILPVLSKCDRPLISHEEAEFFALGLPFFLQVSAVHKNGIKVLQHKIQKSLEELGEKKVKQEKDLEINEDIPKILFLGRPNTGKSSMINALLNENRCIVSDIPGTTRDAIDVHITYQENEYILIDTAGVRKRGKRDPGIEKWALSRTLDHLSRTDIVCLCIDAEIGVTEQDLHLMEYIKEYKTGLVLLVNKWDTKDDSEKTRNDFLWMLKKRFSFVSWCPVLFVSAKTKKNILHIFDNVKNIMEQRKIRIPTGKLNTLIRNAVQKNPPKGTKRVIPKIFYGSQVDTSPPKFKLYVNKKIYFHFSYWRYLENFFREYFGFWGTPLEFDICDRESIYQDSDSSRKQSPRKIRHKKKSEESRKS
jgi:GTP-binding protein